MIAVADEARSLELAIGGYVLIVVAFCFWLMRRRIDKLADAQHKAQATTDRLQRSVKDEMIPMLLNMVDQLESTRTVVHDHLVGTHGEPEDFPIGDADLKALCEDLAELAAELALPLARPGEEKEAARTDDRSPGRA